jgi:hypothetical protein
MAASDEIRPRQGVGPHALGDTEQDIRLRLGEPLSEERDVEVWLDYEALRFQIWPSAEECVSITVIAADGGALPNGVRVGSTLADLRAAYPRLQYDWELMGWLSPETIGVSFYLIHYDGGGISRAFLEDDEVPEDSVTVKWIYVLSDVDNEWPD